MQSFFIIKIFRFCIWCFPRVFFAFILRLCSASLTSHHHHQHHSPGWQLPTRKCATTTNGTMSVKWNEWRGHQPTEFFTRKPKRRFVSWLTRLAPRERQKNKTTTFAIDNMVSLHCLSTPTKPLSIPLSHPKPFARLFERWTIRLRLLHAHTHSLTPFETTVMVVVPVCCKRSTMAIEKQQ